MYHTHSFTERGGHAVNEDAFAIQRHPADARCCVCVLADGQGGRAGGGEAAQLACRVTIETALSLSPKQLAKTKSWPSILLTADVAVQESAVAGLTTLVALAVVGSTVVGASSGDSAAIVFNNGKQTLRLTGRQAKNPPVGSGFAEFVPFSSKLIMPWQILLMSDGVWKYCGWERITAVVQEQTGNALIDVLQSAARLPESGDFQDDFTLVAIEGDD